MIIENNKVVSLTYELKDGKTSETIEVVESQRPLTFLFGHGNLLSSFESNIKGLKAGDSFSFELKPEEAYGLVNENAISDLPKSIFIIDGKLAEDLLHIGNIVPMRDSAGHRLDGRIIAITDEIVRMDFNHPMAGKSLNFNGRVEEIRDATEEELIHGHIHFNASSCGDCSSCGSSCESDEYGDSCQGGCC